MPQVITKAWDKKYNQGRGMELAAIRNSEFQYSKCENG